MEKVFVLSSVFILFFSAQVKATCPADTSATTNVEGWSAASNTFTLFSNKTICATSASDTWHEYHNSSGSLIKIGDGSTVDPSVPVGTWSGEAGATITYTYTGDAGSPYQYKVYVNGNNVNLCGAVEVTGVLADGQSGPGCN